ncbi:MAG: NAD(+)/NADH kinase [Micrococcales bacterium]|nr:NAD(+)/NADH kinase [Micrococcales bacterium]
MAEPTASGSRLAAIVYNPIKVDLARLRLAVAGAEQRHRWADSLWLETTEEDPGGGQAAAAIGAGAEVVVAAGGDGTVRAVAEALRDGSASLALMPAGTGNLLARNLGLTLDDIEDAIENAFAGEDAPIDVGVARLERRDGSRDEHAFMVMAGIGVDAQMAANTNPELKKRFGWIAYVHSISRSLLDRNRIVLRYELDDSDPTTTRVHSLLIGNCGTLPGNLLLLPEAEVNDGLFDIVALRPKGFLGWVQIWFKIAWENGVLRRSLAGRKLLSMTKPVRTLRYLRGRRITVRIDHRPTEFELDGDPYGEVVAFRCTVDHDSLRIRVPEGHPLTAD